jgi:hypothetical protein
MLSRAANKYLAMRVVASAFLKEAERLLENDQLGPELATVTAQMAFEVYIEGALAALLSRQIADDDVVDATIELLESKTMLHQDTRDFYKALTGDRISRAPMWKEYQAHVQRRNNLVHGRISGEVTASWTRRPSRLGLPSYHSRSNTRRRRKLSRRFGG